MSMAEPVLAYINQVNIQSLLIAPSSFSCPLAESGCISLLAVLLFNAFLCAAWRLRQGDLGYIIPPFVKAGYTPSAYRRCPGLSAQGET
jgi:hypothetical protein